MDAASRTWPPPNPSPAPFSSRLRASSDSHRRRRRRHSKKSKPEPPPPPPAPPNTAPVFADFADLPQELLHRALSASGAADVSAASRACRAWRDALQPLREAAALHAHGRRLKHGPAVPAPCGVEGRDVARRSALGMFQRAARLGSAAAMVDAGLLCWEEGQREEAMGYYRRAAELGHPVGMCNLGVSYLEADPPEAEEAVRWFYPAASAGNVRAQYNLGLCLQNGKGIKRNQREAAKWYLRAAEGGNVRAMYNVSLCYCLGEGFTQDHVRAKKWLQLAADCGHKKALYECGLKLCAAGDKIRSFMYLELATRRGEAAASHMRDVMLESLSPMNTQLALSEADKWRPKALYTRR